MGQPTSDPEPTVPFGQDSRPDDHGYPLTFGQSAHPVPYGADGGAYPPDQPSGIAYQPFQAQYQPDPQQQGYLGYQSHQKSRLAAGLLAIFLGGLGIHNFYLDRVGRGVVQLLITVLSLGLLAPLVWIWVLVEAILILTRSPSFAADARGVPLRD